MSGNLTKILVVGTGKMGAEYVKVLNALQVPFDVVGRSAENCLKFEKEHKVTVLSGGLESIEYEQLSTYSHAILASSVESLSSNIDYLLKSSIESVLVEKPGAINQHELAHLSSQSGIERFWIGYNRRFYASVLKAEEIIKQDGGLTSFFFDFTEWAHKIEASPKSSELKQNWLLANSSHVIDLAFFLGGTPAQWSSYSSGELSWHPRSIFSGAGKTDKDILFSYYSNWESAGRWSIELNTAKRKLLLSPMESLDEILKGTIERRKCLIDGKQDMEFKPGLYLQVKSFIEKDFSRLVSFGIQAQNAKIYSDIINGSSY